MTQTEIQKIVEETKKNLSNAFIGNNAFKKSHLLRIKEAGDSLNLTLIHQSLNLQDQINELVLTLIELMKLEISSHFIEVIIMDSVHRITNASKICKFLIDREILEGKLNIEFEKADANEYLIKKMNSLNLHPLNSDGSFKSISLHGLKSILEKIVRNKIISNRLRWFVSMSLQSNLFNIKSSDQSWVKNIILEINKLLSSKEAINSSRLLDSPLLLSQIQSIELFRDEPTIYSLLIMNTYSIALNMKDSKEYLNKSNFPICSKPLLFKTQLLLKQTFDVQLTIDEIEKYIKNSFSDDPNFNIKFPSPIKK
jgi:hypothetical protein